MTSPITRSLTRPLTYPLTASLGSILGQGGGWTPIKLGSKLVAWWTADRSDLITSNGGLVSSWKDVVGGYNCAQATSSAQPFYSSVGFNGAPGVMFDGIGDYLELTGVPAAFPQGSGQQAELWALVDQTALAADNVGRIPLTYGTPSTGQLALKRAVSSGLNKADLQVINQDSVLNTPEFIGRHVIRGVAGATLANVYMDGTIGSTITQVPNTGTTRVRIGAALSNTPANFWQGSIRDCIVTLPLTTDEAALLNTYLSNRSVSSFAPSLPPLVTALNVTSVVIDSQPTAADISSRDGSSVTPWYNGDPFQGSTPSSSLYTTDGNGMLNIALGGHIATVNKVGTPGSYPLLSGAKAFYVEYEVALSTTWNDDFFPAVWLMPVEHVAHSPLNDHYEDLDPGNSQYERWLEIDVDEGGFVPTSTPKSGARGVTINWEGIFTNGYTNQQSQPRTLTAPIDRTQFHKFAALYDPSVPVVHFFLDGIWQYAATGNAISIVANRQNFFPIISAQTHGLNVAYSMIVKRFRALVAP